MQFKQLVLALLVNIIQLLDQPLLPFFIHALQGLSQMLQHLNSHLVHEPGKQVAFFLKAQVWIFQSFEFVREVLW
jgi:hypothetical protein